MGRDCMLMRHMCTRVAIAITYFAGIATYTCMKPCTIVLGVKGVKGCPTMCTWILGDYFGATLLIEQRVGRFVLLLIVLTFAQM